MKLKRAPLLAAFISLLISTDRGFSQNRQEGFLALGDSYTIGESVQPTERWPVQLANLLKQEDFVLGEPTIIARTGWRTDQLISAIERANLKQPYQLVSLLIGVNNQFQGRSEEEYRQQFVELLNRAIFLAGGEKSRVIVLSIPDWSVTPYASSSDRAQIARDIDRFNAINKQESIGAGVAYIDITPISRRAVIDRDLIANDGLHPSAKMYREWALSVLPAARTALEKQQIPGDRGFQSPCGDFGR